MQDVSDHWTGGIEELVDEANRRLRYRLPEERSLRLKDEVNARLVRHYTTTGLLSPPVRVGRDARYSRVHLLNLLALRRLMADGLSGRALSAALTGRSEGELAELAGQGSAWLDRRRDRSGQSALAYAEQLKREAALPAPLLSGPPVRVSSPGRTPPPARTMLRLEVRPGLTLELEDTFRAPPDAWERRQLLDAIGAALDELETLNGERASWGSTRTKAPQD
jgi:DNA-binding transcriptional MerR regulator